jgi:hypothetical protein
MGTCSSVDRVTPGVHLSRERHTDDSYGSEKSLLRKRRVSAWLRAGWIVKKAAMSGSSPGPIGLMCLPELQRRRKRSESGSPGVAKDLTRSRINRRHRCRGGSKIVQNQFNRDVNAASFFTEENSVLHRCGHAPPECRTSPAELLVGAVPLPSGP